MVFAPALAVTLMGATGTGLLPAAARQRAGSHRAVPRIVSSASALLSSSPWRRVATRTGRHYTHRLPAYVAPDGGDSNPVAESRELEVQDNIRARVTPEAEEDAEDEAERERELVGGARTPPVGFRYSYTRNRVVRTEGLRKPRMQSRRKAG